MKIGVLAFQGAVSEHLKIITKAAKELGIRSSIVFIKTKGDFDGIDLLIIPRGESTTISKDLVQKNMIEKIKKMAIPIMGTCAGCILLAEEIEPPYHNLRTLGLMSMSVCRNAFGRQRYSFETKLKIKGFKDYYQAVFIRAPVIKNVWDDCEVLAKFEDNIVAVR